MSDELTSISLKCFPPIHDRFMYFIFFEEDKIEEEDAIIGTREHKFQ